MSAFHKPPFAVRRGAPSEAALIGDLRLASLIGMEMPNHALGAIRGMTEALPDVDRQLLASGRYFVAEADGELIGGAGWSVLPLSFRTDRLDREDGRPVNFTLDGGSILIRGLFLDPDAGRRGVGAAIMAHLEADAARFGYAAAELLVPTPAQMFYRSLGFRPARRLQLRLGRAEALPLLQMRKSIPLRMAAAA